jgi:hypothetical protein
MDGLGHATLEELTPDSATVMNAKQVTIERVSPNEVAVSLLLPGRDNLVFTLSAASEIAVAHCHEMKSDEEIRETRFEILPNDSAGFYVVDHWKDEPYPVFPDLTTAEEFVASRP